jgi:hypothetical protein
MRENDLKIQLFRFLLRKRYKWQFFASEVPFLGLARFIDVCAGTKKHTYAFEIKGDKDKLLRLSGQLKDMLLSFDFVFVVTTEKHVKAVLKKSPRRVGVLLWDGKKLREARKPLQNKKLDPASLLTFISKSDLIKNYRALIPNKNTTSYEMRKIVARKLDSKEVAKLKRNALKTKYERRTKIFLKEVGERLTSDDLEILRSDFPTGLKVVE